MKKLLIMSITLFFSVPIFAQTSTIRRPSNVAKPSTTLTLLKPTQGGGTAVTRPSRPSVSDERTTLSLLKPTQGGGTAVTRPSRPSASGEEAKTLPTLIDKTGKQTVEKTKVVRPTESSSRGGTRRR